MTTLQPYQQQFIQLAIEHHVLTFGDFTLKSGRKSPYFFNTGLFYKATALKQLGEFYAEAIIAAKLSFDILFGPAYKGIPLVTSTGIALSERGYDYPIAFNRKEIKDHGEGGNLIGAPLQGKRILILDDVITAGTAFNESKKLIESSDALVAGVIIALDRQEKSTHPQDTLSALQKIQQTVPVVSLITLEHLMIYLQDTHPELMAGMQAYRTLWGC